MTGEIYAACARPHDPRPADAGRRATMPRAFLRGVRDGARPGGPGALLNRLFGVRTAGLFGEIDRRRPRRLSERAADRRGDRRCRRGGRRARCTIIASDELARALSARPRRARHRDARSCPSDCIAAGHLSRLRALAGLIAADERERHGSMTLGRGDGGAAAGRDPARRQAGRGGGRSARRWSRPAFA